MYFIMHILLSFFLKDFACFLSFDTELIDAEEQKTYWAPVEAKYAEFIGKHHSDYLNPCHTILFWRPAVIPRKCEVIPYTAQSVE